MAHYHMGGIRVDANMQTRIEGLYAAGEAVGGANGANRLSGNAITEAFVFGERAGSRAAEAAQHATSCIGTRRSLQKAIDTFAGTSVTNSPVATAAPIALQAELQKLMWEQAGPFRTGEKLTAALARIEEMQQDGSASSAHRPGTRLQSRSARLVRVARDADDGGSGRPVRHLARTESRGAHQREDFPDRRTRVAQEPSVGAERRQPVGTLGRSGSTQSQRIESWLIQSAKLPRLRVRRGSLGEAVRYDDFRGALRRRHVGARRAALDSHSSR